MNFMEKTYIDVDALNAELDIRRGKEGIQNYVDSLPQKDEMNMPSGRSVLDWT